MRFTDLPPEEQDEIVETFYDRFAGRLDTYAIRVEFGADVAYMPSTYDGESQYAREKIAKIVRDIGTPEFGREAIRAHLEGRYLIGAYPITKDSTVAWFAFDFDRKNDDDPDPFEAAVNQATTLVNEAGLTVYVERSQGGKGYHVWGFLDGEVNAGKLRHALSPYIEDVASYDRMFPNQDGLSAVRPLGNLIALPLHGERLQRGNSAFVRRDPQLGDAVVLKDQFAFLREIAVNPVARIEEMFVEAGDYQPEREARPRDAGNEGLADGWKVAHPRFGCEWVKWCYDNPHLVDEPQWHALACQFAQLADGRELFHEWSAQDKGRYNPRATDKKFDHALHQNKPHTCEAIRGLGGHCECDRRFPVKVTHPYDLAKQSFLSLVESVGTDGDVEHHIVTSDEAIEWVWNRLREIEDDPESGQGRKYGIESLDRHTRLRDSDLVLVCARSGMGKTAFAGTVMDNGARAGEPQYFFSAEMAAKQFWMRQTSTHSGVSATRMATGQMTGKDWDKLRQTREAFKERAQYPIFVDDMSRSTERIFEVAAQLVHTHGKGTVWIDYLQLLQRRPRESMFDAVTRIVHELKLLAKALDVTVVALTQLNRTADDANGDSTTQDSMLRGSGDLEQTADVIIFLLGEKGPGVKERIAALHKERHREAGLRIPLEFSQPTMRYADQGTFGVTYAQAPGGGSVPRTDDGADTGSGEDDSHADSAPAAHVPRDDDPFRGL